MFGYGLNRWFASVFGPTGFARPFRRHMEGHLVTGQANACQDAYCGGGYSAWHDIAFVCALAAKDRDLHNVQFLSGAVECHVTIKGLCILFRPYQHFVGQGLLATTFCRNIVPAEQNA